MTDTAQKRVHIRTWGCQMNSYDTKRMLDVLSPLGYTETDAPQDADIVILNTCHIREKATDKVFSDLGRMKAFKDARERTGHKQIIAVAGCVAQAEGDFIAQRAPYVDMVFGPQTYHRLPEMVAQAFDLYGSRRVIATELEANEKFDQLPEEKATQGASAFLSVQEGCDKFCAFCVVPYTRGAEYSRPVAQVLNDAKSLLRTGAKELVILGQNVNAYHGEGPDGRMWTLGDLLFELAGYDGLERLRYMTSHPNDMHDRLYDAHRDIPSLMPFLHLPVQSGSDKILGTMNRKHTRDTYFAMIDRLRAARPDLAFSTDFIVGFPGETDHDFEDTMDLVRRVNFASAYSFKYSPRPGTPATTMKGLVAEKVKDERLYALQALLADQQVAFNQSFVGKTLPVLFDRAGARAGQIHGRSPYNQAIHVAGQDRLIGCTMDVVVEVASQAALTGSLIVKQGE